MTAAFSWQLRPPASHSPCAHTLSTLPRPFLPASWTHCIHDSYASSTQATRVGRPYPSARTCPSHAHYPWKYCPPPSPSRAPAPRLSCVKCVCDSSCCSRSKLQSLNSASTVLAPAGNPNQSAPRRPSSVRRVGPARRASTDFNFSHRATYRTIPPLLLGYRRPNRAHAWI